MGCHDRREAVTTRLAKGVAPCWIPQEGEKRSEEEVMSEAGMGVKKRSETRQRQRRFQIRILESEYAELARLAEREGVTIATYIRSKTLTAPTTRAVRRPVVEQAVLSQLVAQLRRVGSNLNQIARGINQGEAVTQGEIQAALAEHRQILAAVIVATGRQSR